jgi:hypothetical protein
MVTAQLAAALRAGVRLDYSADPQRPAFRVLPAQRSLVTVLLEPATKPETQRMLRLVAAYRAVLLRLFALAAEGGGADVEVRARRLILSATEQEYTAATQSCAYCGGQH